MDKLNLAANLDVYVTFSPEDLNQLKASGISVPNFWTGHLYPPAVGDVLRFGEHQTVISSRVWEHNGNHVVLRLYVSRLERRTDTSMH